MSCIVEKNKYGFYELKKKPTPESLNEYYSKKYFQESRGNYQKKYTQEEMHFINNKIEQKYRIITKLLPVSLTKRRFLDIGCGEGWALKNFSNKSWDVTGLDYSEFGCSMQNSEMLEYMKIGDINDSIEEIMGQEKKFDVIWLDNVLEHLIDPLDLLYKSKKLITKDGVLVIEVPNDFSLIQQYLLENRYITNAFWVAVPDHISYFNLKGLINICNEAGLACNYIMGDFPIDFFLLNEDTNYVKDKNKGKNCHNARVSIENLLHSVSPDKTNELYRIFAEMGLGRSITGFFRNKEEL